jgi:hypothetical protein
MPKLSKAIPLIAALAISGCLVAMVVARTPPTLKPQLEASVLRVKMYCMEGTPNTKTVNLDGGGSATMGPNCLTTLSVP